MSPQSSDGDDRVATDAGGWSFSEDPTTSDCDDTGADESTLECWDGDRFRIPGGPSSVVRAWYGDGELPWQDGAGKLCTQELVDLLEQRAAANNFKPVALSGAWLGFDPAPGAYKVLLVELRVPTDVPAAHVVQVEPPMAFDSPAEVPSAPNWLLFARHAQAGHNVDEELVAHPDNPLTETGRAQAWAAGQGPLGELLRSADLVVTSPLRRAMETTALVLEAAGAQDARVMVHAGATERWGAPCDEGTPKSELLQEVPEPIKCWEGWDALPERWWPEPGEDAWERADAFAEKIRRELPEERIAFVGHGAFWEMVVGRYLDNCEHVCCERQLASA